MHRVKVMGRLSDSKHTAGPTSPTLLSADLAGALYAEGKPNIRANGNQMERKKIVPLKGKTLDCIGLDEPFKPNPAPKRTPERADVVAVCQLLREKIAAYQAALDALHQL